jgi:putative membrane protein insertion efficiency factor
MVDLFKKITGFIFLVPVYIYKYVISPYTPASCRHTPTCSEYFIEAVKIHGPLKGSWMGIKRISRCHPWGTHGYDPVPVIPIKKYKPKQKKKRTKASRQ